MCGGGLSYILMGEGEVDRVMGLGYGTVDGEANADVQKNH
jgi:hypothetical protein